MKILFLTDSYGVEGGMNQTTGEGQDSWITSTPGATPAPIAGVVTGNGFEIGGNVSGEWCSLSPDDNNGMVPRFLRDIEAAGITTENNIHLGQRGGVWQNQEVILDTFIASNPNAEFDAVVIYLGINTAAGGDTPAGYGPQLDSILAKVVSTYDPLFVLHAASATLSNKPGDFPPATYEPRVDDVNTTIQDRVSRYPYLYYSDTFNSLCPGHTIVANRWQTNNIHPNSTGSGDFIGAQLAPDFIAAKSAAEANMAIFGKDGSGVGVPAVTAFTLNSGSGIRASTFDGTIAAGLCHTGVGNEKIVKAYAVMEGKGFEDVDVRACLYSTSIDSTLNSPVNENRLSVSDVTMIPITDSGWQIYEFFFSSAYAPSAGEVIIGAMSLPLGRIGIGADTPIVTHFRESDDAPAIWDSVVTGSQDLYIWFETEPLDSRPELTTPYSIQSPDSYGSHSFWYENRAITIANITAFNFSLEFKDPFKIGDLMWARLSDGWATLRFISSTHVEVL